MTRHVVAALQIGTDPAGTAATVRKILSYEQEIAESGARLVVLPEALLGGYPKGETFDTRLGYRLPEGRVRFADYVRKAISVPGPETDELEGLAHRTGAAIVCGVIELAGSTLYCTAVFIDPEKGYVAKHRKLMPTGSERLIWGQGDGSTMPVVDTPAGKAGAVICWENYMPLLRTAMYAKGLEIWCAPTMDTRDSWQATMRHIAVEGRCFVIGACQFMPSPASMGQSVEGLDDNEPLIAGRSVIVGPLGDVLAGPLEGGEGLIHAEIDLAELPGTRYDFDAVGHYSRPDVFSLHVDSRPKPAVIFENDRPAE